LNGVWLGDVPGSGGEYGFGFSLGWQFTPHFEAGAYFERTTGKTAGTLEAIPSRYTSWHSLNAFGIYVGGRSGPFLSVVRAVGRAGGGLVQAAYRESENGFVTEGSDRSFGWTVSAGVEVSLTEGLSLTATGGYQSTVLDGFGVSFFMPASPPVVLEFKGFVARAGLTFRF
jgi:opacity protein-like surface antigen